MNLIDRINSVEEAISFRDHFAKTLQADLSINLKQRKLDEIVAHMLGSNNWNTVLGQLTAKTSNVIAIVTSPRFNPSINPEDIIDLIQCFVSLTRNDHFIYSFEESATILLEELPDFMSDVLKPSEMDYELLIHEVCKADGRMELIGLLISMGIEKLAFSDRDYFNNFDYLTQEQIDDANGCIFDSNHEIKYKDMEAFKYDLSLQSSFLEYTRHTENE
jgi:hypothetical protein